MGHDRIHPPLMETEEVNSGRGTRVVLLLGLASALIAAFLCRDRLNLEALDSAIKEAGLLGPLVFMLLPREPETVLPMSESRTE